MIVLLAIMLYAAPGIVIAVAFLAFGVTRVLPTPATAFPWNEAPRYLSFPKIQSGGIRAVGQNQRIIRCDVCDHPPACNVFSRSVQVTTPA
jgi:hypothetical protein